MEVQVQLIERQYIHKGSKKTKEIHYCIYKGIRNAITKEWHRHRNSCINLYTFLYLGTMDIDNMVLN